MYSVEILLLATAATTLASLQRAETHATYTPNNLTVAFCVRQIFPSTRKVLT